MSGARVALFVVGALASISCGGDDDAVAIEDIPPDKRLVDLSAEEEQGVCNWARDVSKDDLPAPGSELVCGGITITWNGVSCGFPTSEQAGCESTVQEWQTCFPAFVDRIAEDPCVILDLVFPDDVEAFVESIPGCEGLGPCSYTTR